MARPLRVQYKDGWYHVINRGIDRADIYRGDRDREHFLELLESASERLFLEIHCYVLMDNHYHLVLRVPEANLSQCMQWLNVSYSIWFNRRHNRIGPLFQGRYKSVPVEGGAWVYQLSQYVHLNPVRVGRLGLDKRRRRLRRQGLAAATDRAEVKARLKTLKEYRWSSYLCYAGYEETPSWLSCATILKRAGGKSRREQTERYRADLERYVRDGYEESRAVLFQNNLAVGADAFRETLKRGLSSIDRETPCKRELRRMKTFEGVVRSVEAVKGEGWRDFSRKHGDWGRDMVLALAREFTGMTLREIGEASGGMDYSAVSEAIKRLKRKKEEDHKLATAFNKAIQMLNIET